MPRVKSAHDARSQLDTVLHRSNDAILQVQEGIVVEANPAWLELFGVEEGIAGQPVMDLFEEATHAALRGALAACLQGRWSNDHPLRANALLADGSVVPLEITLTLGEHEGEPCVRLVVPSRPREERPLRSAAAAAAASRPQDSCAAPSCWKRSARASPLPRRAACAAWHCIRLDKFAALERVVGATASEDVPGGVSRACIKDSLTPKDLAGRFGGVRFLVLLERGNENDIKAWSERLLGAPAEARHAGARQVRLGHLHDRPRRS